MATIKLGNRPKNFKRKLRIPMLEGGEGTLEVSYIYRTRKEFGELLDKMVEEGKLKAAEIEDAEDAAAFNMTKMMTGQAEANADYIMRIADGWDIKDAEFNRENVLQLCDEQPAAALTWIETYRVACTDGRLGN